MTVNQRHNLVSAYDTLNDNLCKSKFLIHKIKPQRLETLQHRIVLCPLRFDSKNKRVTWDKSDPKHQIEERLESLNLLIWLFIINH
ncbi:hypothetical protein CWD94_14210 [Lysinibacillus xylanilyticus]|uniref:Uncharacterized protein n=1 Tax=Lysinibacillus xylanilyticus TaxID=582475 RepID=A0A2M9Q4C1_9BACI|nr:hypothetical protein CWD94_14210 [Lysinibacillus xylanilyticus]